MRASSSGSGVKTPEALERKVIYVTRQSGWQWDGGCSCTGQPLSFTRAAASTLPEAGTFSLAEAPQTSRGPALGKKRVSIEQFEPWDADRFK